MKMKKFVYAFSGLLAFLLRVLSLMALVWLLLALSNRFLGTALGFPRATIMPGQEDNEFLIASLMTVGGFLLSLFTYQLEKWAKPVDKNTEIKTEMHEKALPKKDSAD